MAKKQKDQEMRAKLLGDHLEIIENTQYETLDAVRFTQKALTGVETSICALPIGPLRTDLEKRLVLLHNRLGRKVNELLAQRRRSATADDLTGSRVEEQQANGGQTVPKTVERNEPNNLVNVIDFGPFECETSELLNKMMSEIIIWDLFQTVEARLLPLDQIPPDLATQLAEIQPNLGQLARSIAELSHREDIEVEVVQAYGQWRNRLHTQWSALWREYNSRSKDQQVIFTSTPARANSSTNNSTSSSDSTTKKPAMIALPKREITKFTDDPKSWLSFRRDVNLLLEDDHHSKEFRFTALETATNQHRLARSIVSRFSKESDLKGAVEELAKEFENPVTLIKNLEKYVDNDVKNIPECFSAQDIIDFFIHMQYIRQQLDLAKADDNTKNKLVRPLQTKLPMALRTHLRKNHGEFEEFVRFIDDIYDAKNEIANESKTVSKPSPSVKFSQNRPKFRQFGAVNSLPPANRPINVPPPVNTGTPLVAQQTRPKHVDRDISNSCIFCPADTHNSKACRKGPGERRRRAWALQLCYRCLRSYPCSCRNSCPYCNGPHHQLICERVVTSNNQSMNNVYRSNTYRPPGNFRPDNDQDIPEGNVGAFQARPATPEIVHEIKGTPVRQMFWCEIISATRVEKIRVFVDPGSEVTLLHPRLLPRLAMKGTPVKGMIITGPGSGPKLCTEQVAFRLNALDGSTWCRVQAWVYPQIEAISIPPIPKDLIAQARKMGIVLSEEQATRITPDLVIGVDFADSRPFTAKEILRITPSVIASHLPFGWALRGFYQQELVNDSAQVASYSAVPLPCSCNLLRRIFDLEEEDSNGGSKLEISYDEEQKRFVVSLPWIGSHRPSSNYGSAKAQVVSLKKRLEQSGELELYHEAISEFVQADYAETAEPKFVQESYYLPHHPVFKPGAIKTKCRPVFNASASIPNGKSLNRCLSRGEPINCDLNLALVNFRLARVPLVSDVVKAFLQIRIAEADRDYLRYFWYENLEDKEPTLFRLKSLLFGANCSPHILGAVLVKMFNDWKEKYPTLRETREIVYMDDLILDVEDQSQVESVIRETEDLMARGSFSLHEWVTVENVRETVPHLPFKAHHAGEETKCLGVAWSPVTDMIILKCDVKKPESVTKRTAAAFFGKLYDPMGLLLPFRMKVRLFARQISLITSGWDVPLPADLIKEFESLTQEYGRLKLEVPRSTGRLPARLVIFCDASMVAYGAVAYVLDEEMQWSLLCAKSKLAPLKRSQKIELEIEEIKKAKKTKLSIPRFELCAAVMGIELYEKLKESPRLADLPCDIYCDSQITLYRIKNNKLHSEIYVQNRLDRIFELMNDKIRWLFVRTANNPADSLTHGHSVAMLAKNDLWWQGPDLAELHKDQEAMRDYKPPPELLDGLRESLEAAEANVAEDSNSVGSCAAVEQSTPVKEDKWKFILDLSFDEAMEKVAGLIECKPKSMEQRNENKSMKLDKESYSWIKLWRSVQRDSFKKDYELLCRGRTPNDHRLRSAKVYADEWGVLRTQRPLPPVFSFSTRYPIVLTCHKIWKSFVAREHHRLRHPGINSLYGHLLEQFFVFKGKRMVTDFTRRCYHCNFYRGKPFSVPMAPLPVDRTLEAATPFTAVGVDFFGPITIAANRKVYGLLFACNRTRAIHLEVVTSLATANCIMAFQRFFARRGIPEEIRSDNATTFHASNSVLARLARKVEEASTDEGIKKLGIRWKFNAPKAAWWGGPFERMIGTVKKRLIDVEWKGLSLEMVWTVMCEVEAMINSRPLFGMASNEPPITPGHFFAGRKLISLPAIPTLPTPEPILQTYLKLQELLSLIWKRWQAEYVLELKRQHVKLYDSREPEIGEWVLMNDEPKPRGQWPTGRVIKIYPGIDGKVRVAEIRTTNGSVYKRAVQHLIPLEASPAGPRRAPEDVASRDVTTSVE